MDRKTLPLTGIKTAGLAEGQFEGWASTFGNVDSDGDRVMAGAFTKSLSSDRVVPLLWMHQASDPRNFVGELVKAEEVAEGLHVVGQFDLDTDFGQAAYRAVKSRRASALSIGYTINRQTKGSDGANELHDLDLAEVSIVARGANEQALVTAVKAADTPGTPTQPIRTQLARAAFERYVKEGPKTMMTTTRLELLTKDRQSQMDSIQTILDTAEALKEDLSAEAAAEVAAGTEKIRELDAKIAAGRHDLEVISQARALAAEVGLPPYDGGDPVPVDGGHIALTGKHAKAMAGRITKAMPKDQTGQKALAAGQQTTSTIVLPEVVEIGRPAVSVLDVLPSRVVPPSYSFIQQSVRTLAAAPVAEGGTKPTSVISVKGVQNRLRVVAHVSEPIPHYLLSDAGQLQQFVVDELVFGLRRAVEAEVLAGDGTGEHFTGILATSGIVSQSFATDCLTSVSHALTTISATGYEPGVICLSALDWEAITLQAATTTAVAYQGVPVDPTARRLFGVPVTLSQQLGAKTGLVIANGAVTVDHDGVVDTRWSDAVGTDFTQNMVRCRVEGRFGVSVSQPAAVVKVGTQA